MSILNYFFIGVSFTFIVDLLLNIERVKNHPTMKDQNWGVWQRILCVTMWPLSVLIFLISFVKQFFKR